jgi:prepilin-type processing-associated H-X9-DG protein
VDGGAVGSYNLGYGANVNVVGFVNPPSTTEIAAPADTILVADAAEIATGGSNVGLESTNVIYGPSLGGNPTTYAVHSQKCNVAWTDGHSKSSSLSIRPASFYSSAQAQSVAQTNFVGDVMNSQHGYGDAWQDFYYRIDKPQ